MTSNGTNYLVNSAYNVPKELVPQIFDVRSNSQAGIDPLSQVAPSASTLTLEKIPSDL